MPDTETVSCVLHAGAHKTATSLLQKYLRDRSEHHAQLGISYISRSDTNRLIGWGEVPESSPEKLRAAVEKTSRPEAPIVVISHENSLGRPLIATRSGLYPDAAGAASGLGDALRGIPTTVIYYIRSQAQFLESYYLQTIHQGSYQPFDEWLSGVDVDSCSWVPVIENLKSAFGSEHVGVRDFAEISHGQESFIRGFLDIFTSTTDMEIEYPTKRNLSISQLGLDISLDVNPLLETAEERRAMRKFLQKHFNNSTGDRPTLFDPDAKEDINAMFARQNAQLVTP